jgi:hypothetical protein
MVKAITMHKLMSTFAHAWRYQFIPCHTTKDSKLAPDPSKKESPWTIEANKQEQSLSLIQRKGQTEKINTKFFLFIYSSWWKIWFQEDFKLQTHLELGIQIPGKSGNRQPLILPQAHHDFLHHQSISLAPPPLAKSQEDSKAEVYQSAHSDLLFFLSLL